MLKSSLRSALHASLCLLVMLAFAVSLSADTGRAAPVKHSFAAPASLDALDLATETHASARPIVAPVILDDTRELAPGIVGHTIPARSLAVSYAFQTKQPTHTLNPNRSRKRWERRAPLPSPTWARQLRGHTLKR